MDAGSPASTTEPGKGLHVHAAAPRGVLLIALMAMLSAGALFVNLLPAMASGPVGVAARFALAPTCHQQPERSFSVSGRALGACARCTGLHASGMSAGLAALALGAARLARHVAALRVLALIAGAALVVDAVAGAWMPAWDHAGLRAATGLAAGTLLLLWGVAETRTSAALRTSQPREVRA